MKNIIRTYNLIDRFYIFLIFFKEKIEKKLKTNNVEIALPQNFEKPPTNLDPGSVRHIQ